MKQILEAVKIWFWFKLTGVYAETAKFFIIKLGFIMPICQLGMKLMEKSLHMSRKQQAWIEDIIKKEKENGVDIDYNVEKNKDEINRYIENFYRQWRG